MKRNEFVIINLEVDIGTDLAGGEKELRFRNNNSNLE